MEGCGESVYACQWEPMRAYMLSTNGELWGTCVVPKRCLSEYVRAERSYGLKGDLKGTHKEDLLEKLRVYELSRAQGRTYMMGTYEWMGLYSLYYET